MILRLSRTGDAARLARASGHDWVSVDMEHNTMSIATAVEICIAALDSGVTPIVRVPGHQHFHASRVLDGGAMGIIVPHVNTAEEARAAVAACKFPPVGHRSVMGNYVQLGFEPMPLAEATRTLNQNTLLAVMLETPEAIANVDSIAAIDGIDVIHVGTSDLLAEMGLTGQFDHPEVAKAFERVIAAARRHGRFAGMGGVRDPGLFAKYLKMGFRFLTTNSDLAFLLQAASARAKEIRGIKRD